ncbi:MAG: zinc-binding dehydrogenase [Planctomycetes bacterium]|nr:zinc-binding dehydrogenase [Planctomycetota bacterium]
MDNYRVLFTGKRKVELEKVAVPRPAQGQVLVRNHASAISTGTELTILTGEFPTGSVWDRITRYPSGSGYSSIGRIVEVGPGVEGYAAGDRVICGSHHGHFAVRPADPNLLRIPDAVTDEAAALYRLAEICMNGVRRGQPQWGECAVVYGLGVIGQLVAVFARLAGCRPVVGIDVSATRRELARRLGIHLVLDGNAPDLPDQVKAANHGRLADLVYEVTAVGELIPKEMELLRRQGRIVIVSSPRTKTLIDLHDLCNSPSLSIIGAHNSSHPAHETPYNPWTTCRNIELFFDSVARAELDAAALITHRYPWWKAPEAYQMLLDDRGRAGAVVLDWTAENQSPAL